MESQVEFLELGGNRALAGEQEGVGHFAEDETEGEGGRGEERGAVQDRSQGFGEGGVGDGFRGDHVERAGDVAVFESEEQHGDGVFERDPAHPLEAISNFSAQPELKGPHDLRQCAAMPGEEDAEAGADDADAEDFGFDGFRFPILCEITEKIGAGRAVFREKFVAAIAVIAGGGGGDQHTRARRHFGEGVDEGARGVDAAGAEELLALSCPAAVRDGGASEIDDSVGADSSTAEFAGSRIPLHVEALGRADGFGGGPGTDEPANGVAAALEFLGEGSADEARGTSEEDFHGCPLARGMIIARIGRIRDL